MPQASQQGMVRLGLEAGQWTPQPGALLSPSALSQEHGFAEDTLSPFPSTYPDPFSPIWYHLRAILVSGWLTAILLEWALVEHSDMNCPGRCKC